MKTLFAVVAAAAIFCSSSVMGAESDSVLQTKTQASVSLEDVLKAVSRNSGDVFAVDSRVPATVVLGQMELKEMDYEQLTLALRNNSLAAVRINNIVNVMPVNTIRQAALPLLMQADDTVGDEEWVTRVFQLEHADPKMMVPILRPLLPQQGHLVAHPASGTLIMVDRYANTERLAKIVGELDVVPKQQE